jgi:hypothetical protein
MYICAMVSFGLSGEAYSVPMIGTLRSLRAADVGSSLTDLLPCLPRGIGNCSSIINYFDAVEVPECFALGKFEALNTSCSDYSMVSSTPAAAS